MRTAVARSGSRTHPPRTLAPRHPRRVSGPARPVARPVKAQPVAVPTRRAVPVDRLLRSRAWIWVIGVGLMGIVAMQVSLLKLNTGISRAVQTSATLERQNAQLEQEIARLGSNERISRIAAERGMLAPDAGQVQFLRARPDDARRAVSHMRPPSADARGLMASGGATATAATVATTPATSTTTTAAPTATPAPAASPAAGIAAAPTPGQG